MKRLACAANLIILALLITEVGCNGAPFSSSKDKFKPFSFAVITDVHIGRDVHDSGIQDYGAMTWADYNLKTGQAIDGNEGGLNYITDRLTATVNWLNLNYQKDNIKFLVILGDITNSAEMSEFFRAKKILDGLEIPYVPLIGNHDVWAWSGEITKLICDIPPNDGQIYFEEIFWGKHNERNINFVKGLFGDSWKRQEELKEFADLPFLQNYYFSYQGINFIALDYTRRDSNCGEPLANPSPETNAWLNSSLETHKGQTAIVFSHHPLMKRGGFLVGEDILTDTAAKNGVQSLSFGGHIHYFDNTNEVFKEGSNTPVIVTKGLMGKTGELKEKEDSDFLRIVKVNGRNVENIDYDNIESVTVPRPAPSPTATNTPRPIATATPTKTATPRPTATPIPKEQPKTLTIINPKLNLSGVTVYQQDESPRHPEGHIFLVIKKEAVSLRGPEVSAKGIDFELRDERIDDIGGWRTNFVWVNSRLSYRLNIEDFEGEIGLAQVLLRKEGEIIKSDFVFLAQTGIPGVIGGIVDVKITAIVNGIPSGDSGQIKIEVRQNREPGVVVPPVTKLQ